MSEKSDWRATAIYKKSAINAREHGEFALYRKSYTANKACSTAIEKAIAGQWDGSRLKDGTAASVIEQFDAERVKFVLASTLQIRQHDGRFSDESLAWAFQVQIEEPPQDTLADRYYEWEMQSHSVKLNDFVQQAKAEIEQMAIREMPVYTESFQYALDNDEMKPYWDSISCNTACARDIHDAIADHYDGYSL